MLAKSIGRAAAVAGFILSGAAAWAAGWGPASGDEKSAAQGCAAISGDEYVCTFVRCDAKGSLNFYAAAPGPDITGDVVMEIDGQRFPMTFRGPGSPALAYTNRAVSLPPGFLAALKTGKVMKIREAGLTAGYDTIPLRNADREIGRIEKICGIEGATAPSGPANGQAQPPPATRPARATPANCVANVERLEGQLLRANRQGVTIGKAEYSRTGTISNATACRTSMHTQSVEKRLLSAMNSCPALPNGASRINGLMAKIRDGQAIVRRNNWCG